LWVLWFALKISKVDCWEKDSGQGLFLTFEDFEFRAAFTDRKNTPTFAAVMITKIKLPFSCLKLRRKFVVILAGYESGRYSGRPANLYLLLRAPILCRHASQQTKKSGAKFKIPKCSKQTQSPFPQQSTLGELKGDTAALPLF
jgi:hypothetical protein